MSTKATSVLALLFGGLLALCPGNVICQKQVTYVQVVRQATPTIRLTSSAALLPYATAVTLTTRLAGRGATPSGAVAFYDGATPLGTGTLSSTGVATFSTSGLGIGLHSITAYYGGEANYSPVTSVALALSVVATAPAVMLTPSLSSITTSQSLTLAAIVSAGNGHPVPTGTVALAGGGYVSPATALSNGSVTFSIPGGSLAAGTIQLTAGYTPDSFSSARYSSSSAAILVTVIAPVHPGYFMLSNSGSITVNSGAVSGNTSTISVTPSAGFEGVVSLSCSVTSNLINPAHPPTCTLGPGGSSSSSATLAGNSAVTTTLKVQTTASASLALFSLKGLFLGGGSATLTCLLLFWVPTQRRGRRGMFALSLFLILLVCGGTLGCGGSSTLQAGNIISNLGTTPGAYVVNVAGTSGTTTVTTTVNLTVE
jgi:hypothetical protein